MTFLKQILLSLFFSIALMNAQDQHVLLQAPQSLSQQEIETFEREGLVNGWGACWNCKDKQILLVYHDHLVEMGLELYGKLPESIDQNTRAQFISTECTKDGECCPCYTLRIGIDQKKDQSKQGVPDKGPYCVHDRRNFKDKPEENKPTIITVEQCAALIKTKRIVFYTGAGISAQAGVWMMQPLMDALGIDRNNQYDQCCQNIITHPAIIKETFSQFCYKGFTAAATPAHKAMAAIALSKQAQILTENFDLLHEHAGTKALHIDGPWLRANVSPDDLKNIDAVVCVALSYDDRGFLGWYKKHNPHGIIIALDLATPSFLGNEDFLLQGDCQKVLPELQQVLDLNQQTFLVGTYNDKEAFDSLLTILERMPFYKSNGYNVSVPSHPLFKGLEEHPENIKTLNKDQYFKTFVANVYKPLNCAPVQKMVDKEEFVLLAALERLQALNKQWGFKIFPHYNIMLVPYGPGGRYDAGLGLIELKVTDDGLPYSRKKLPETIIHEMIHIGIEDLIVKKFQLTHWEKEGLVDLIGFLYLKDLLPNYTVHPSCDENIRKYITLENICNDLPAAIKQYVALYPRDKK